MSPSAVTVRPLRAVASTPRSRSARAASFEVADARGGVQVEHLSLQHARIGALNPFPEAEDDPDRPGSDPTQRGIRFRLLLTRDRSVCFPDVIR